MDGPVRRALAFQIARTREPTGAAAATPAAPPDQPALRRDRPRALRQHPRRDRGADYACSHGGSRSAPRRRAGVALPGLVRAGPRAGDPAEGGGTLAGTLRRTAKERFRHGGLQARPDRTAPPAPPSLLPGPHGRRGPGRSTPRTAASRVPGSPPADLLRTRRTSTGLGAGGDRWSSPTPTAGLLYSAHAGTTHFFTPEAPNPGSLAFGQNYTVPDLHLDERRQRQDVDLPDRGSFPRAGHRRFRLLRPRVRHGQPPAGCTSRRSTSPTSTVSKQPRGQGLPLWTLENAAGAVLTDRQWNGGRPSRSSCTSWPTPSAAAPALRPAPAPAPTSARAPTAARPSARNIPEHQGRQRRGRHPRRQAHRHRLPAARGAAATSSPWGRSARRASGELGGRHDSNRSPRAVDLLGPLAGLRPRPLGQPLHRLGRERPGGARGGHLVRHIHRRGAHLVEPVKVSDGDNTAIWPWVAVGDKGRVGMAGSRRRKLPGHDAETAGDRGWRLNAAATDQGLGCNARGPAATAPSSAGPSPREPVHTGTISQGGTTCQAMAIDRRLGDYFSMDINASAGVYGYSEHAEHAGRGGAPGLRAPATGPVPARPEAGQGRPRSPPTPAAAAARWRGGRRLPRAPRAHRSGGAQARLRRGRSRDRRRVPCPCQR